LLEQLLAPAAQHGLAHRAAHQVSDDCALVLVGKGLVEGAFHIVWHAEVYGGHGFSVVELFNNRYCMRRASEVNGERLRSLIATARNAPESIGIGKWPMAAHATGQLETGYSAPRRGEIGHAGGTQIDPR
jgi:hypothetical protein